jgi:hypothetical protein
MGAAMPDDNVLATDDTDNLQARFPRRGILLDHRELFISPTVTIDQRPGSGFDD